MPTEPIVEEEYRAFVHALKQGGANGEGTSLTEAFPGAGSTSVVAELLRHDQDVRQNGFLVGSRGVLDLLTLSPEDIAEDLTQHRGLAAGGVRRLPEPGEVFGKYRIERVLGRGGMGVVFLAQDTAVRRAVALKALFRGGLERFEQETRAIAQLEHPGIVRFYEAGKVEGLAYYTMEYVLGETLEERYKGSENGGLDVREAAAAVAKVARAVAYAHSRGVLHRDLKPGNILLGQDGSPRVADFGLAKRLDDASGLTMSGEVFGSPSFMAPEQASGVQAEVGEATDIYGLGATLYCAIVGRPPFHGADPHKVLTLVTTELPASPSRSVAGVPADIDTICLKCLEKRPAQRYASAAALADDLERYLRGETILARPVGRIEQVRRWCVRKPTAAGLMATTLASLVLLAGWAAREVVTQRRAKAQYTEALVTRSDLYAQQGKWRDALADLAEAQRLGDTDPRQIAVKRASALLAVSETEAFEATLAELGSMQPLGPYLGDERLLRGLSLLVVGANDEAQQALREAVACEELSSAKKDIALAMLAPTSPESLFLLRKAAEKDPTSHFAQQYLIGCLILMGSSDEATLRCHVATALFPESPTFKMLGDLAVSVSGKSAEETTTPRFSTSLQVAPNQLAKFENNLELVAELTGQFAGAWCVDTTEEEFHREREALSSKLSPLLSKWSELVTHRSLPPGSGIRQSKGLVGMGVPCMQRAFESLAAAGSMRTFGYIFNGKGDVSRIDRLIVDLQAAHHEHPDAIFQLARGRLLYLRGRKAEALAAYDQAAAGVSIARRAQLFGAYSAAVCGLEQNTDGESSTVEAMRRNLTRCIRTPEWPPKRTMKLMAVALAVSDYAAATTLSKGVEGPESEILLTRTALAAGRIDAAVQDALRASELYPEDMAIVGLRNDVDRAVREWAQQSRTATTTPQDERATGL